jgi:DNA-binding beta-propeller fold protein YncE
MALGPDQKLYVTNSNKKDSRIVIFDKTNPDGITRNYVGDFVTPSTTGGLIHPYFLTFDASGDLYISVQDSNIVLGIYGPENKHAGKAKPVSSFLSDKYPKGTFERGTFIPAYTAKIKPETSVPAKKGGLTGNKTQSVRAVAFGPHHTLYVADEGNNRIAVYDRDTGYLNKTISNSHTIHPDQLFFHASDGLLYIACPGDNRIMTYNVKKDELHTFINDAARLKHVSGIAFGEDGNFYAADRKKMVIYQYDPSGKFIKIFAGPFTDSPEGIMPLYNN